MPRRKILWLCSWYPNRLEPFNGDFIQRHARAAALYHDIQVIHVAADVLVKKPEAVTKNDIPGLTEQWIYFPKATGRFARIRNFNRLKSAYQKAIAQYIENNGVPALIHLQVPMMAGLVLRHLPRRWRVPYVVTEHWTIYQPKSPVQFYAQSFFFRAALRGIIQHARLLLPVSRDLGEQINRQVAKKEFEVVENVADTELFYPGTGTSKRFRFIHVSNMSYQKNTEGIVRTFLRLAPEFPNAELVLVGSPAGAVTDIIQHSGGLAEQVFLKGEVPYPVVAEELRAANALVMFSRFENSPCSIIEALCSGLPVIATLVGGIPDLVNDENGILIEEGKEALLEAAMREMMQAYDRYDRNKIAEQAVNRFSYSVIGKKLDTIYERIADHLSF